MLCKRRIWKPRVRWAGHLIRCVGRCQVHDRSGKNSPRKTRKDTEGGRGKGAGGRGQGAGGGGRRNGIRKGAEETERGRKRRDREGRGRHGKRAGIRKGEEKTERGRGYGKGAGKRLADVVGEEVSPRGFDGVGELGGGVSGDLVGEGTASPAGRDGSDGEDRSECFGVDAFFGGGEDGYFAVEEGVCEAGSGDGFAQTGLSFVAGVFLVEVGDLFGDDVFLGADTWGLLECESAVGVSAPDGDACCERAEDALRERETVSALCFAEDEAQEFDAIADIGEGLVMSALESDGFAKEASCVVFAAAAEFEIGEQDIASDL